MAAFIPSTPLALSRSPPSLRGPSPRPRRAPRASLEYDVAGLVTRISSAAPSRPPPPPPPAVVEAEAEGGESTAASRAAAYAATVGRVYHYGRFGEHFLDEVREGGEGGEGEVGEVEEWKGSGGVDRGFSGRIGDGLGGGFAGRGGDGFAALDAASVRRLGLLEGDGGRGEGGVVDIARARGVVERRRKARARRGEGGVRRVGGLPFGPVDVGGRKGVEGFEALVEATGGVPLRAEGMERCGRCGGPAEKAEMGRSADGVCGACEVVLRGGVIGWGAGLEAEGRDRFMTGEEREVAAREERGVVDRTREVVSGFISSRAPGGGRKRDATGVEVGKVGKGGAQVAAGTGTGGSGSGGSVSGEMAASASGEGWNVKASDRSLRTINPIRQLVQGISGKPNPDKELIDLSVGDPTVYGNLRVGEDVIDKFCDVIRTGNNNGYTMSMGSLAARQAVADRYALPSCAPLSADDVVLTSGVSGALELAIGSLANEGDNILLPRPGFPLFKTIFDCYGVKARYYELLPNSSWEVDIASLRAAADHRTAAIIINNPSNPCGSVYSADHIAAILSAAHDLRLPIIADEVYADIVFSPHTFHPLASLSTSVPILAVGGISKQTAVPGWRSGWLLIHDRAAIFAAANLRTGIRNLSTRMLTMNAPVQAVLPTILSARARAPAFVALLTTLQNNAAVLVDALAPCPGLTTVAPQGSMYLMAALDVAALGFDDDLAFTKALRAEESVFVLPGECFQAPNFVRIVFCAPAPVLQEAAARITRFCATHADRWEATRNRELGAAR